jgi:hypothetical protein
MLQTGQHRPRFSFSVLGAGAVFDRRCQRRSISRAMSIGYAWLTVVFLCKCIPLQGVFLCKAGAQPVSLPSTPGSKADDVPKMGHREPNSQLFQLNLAKISDSYSAADNLRSA